MVKSSASCHSLQTSREKRWVYDEYYFGERDSEDRKNGQGENHWTGAESIEWYTGPMLHDTMHGEGAYRWRYKDPDGAFVTYEGQFYANRIHGYGVMSYPDGRVFTGLFHNNVRWGPGVESKCCLQASVGLWRGPQLVRLNWRPAGPSITPDFTTGPTGPAYVETFRIMLDRCTTIPGEINNALEDLKMMGANPVHANKMWMKLYPNYCTDLKSALCYTDLFEDIYYNGKFQILKKRKKLNLEVSTQDSLSIVEHKNNDNSEDTSRYFAWNNSPIMIHMMKHSYRHEDQRARTGLDLEKVLNGSRKKFRPASQHETDCRSLLMACYLGDVAIVTKLVNERDVFPDIADLRGNTALMYAVCGDQTNAMHFLVEAGASINAYNDSCCTSLGVALMRYVCTVRNIPASAMVQALLPSPEGKERKNTKAEISSKKTTLEWYINRELGQTVETKPSSAHYDKKTKSTTTATNNDYDSDEDIFSDEKILFLNVSGDYSTKIANQFKAVAPKSVYDYLFNITDMVKDVQAIEDEINKATATDKKGAGKKEATPKKVTSRSIKASVKSQLMNKSILEGEMTDSDKEKIETLSKILLTIIQLLGDGADPTLVTCPQPAILLAINSRCPELVTHLVSHGADVNEKYPELLDYTPLDVVISMPFTNDNVAMIQALLEIGADTNHRLKLTDSEAEVASTQAQTLAAPVQGPTLLHAVLAKKAEFEFEEYIRRQVMAMLLQYNADPTLQYSGRSPIECAMIKKFELLEVFIKSSSAHLNSIINDRNHTILFKLFSRDYFKTTMGLNKLTTLTNLLLYGADPLIECYDGDVLYENVFEFARKTLQEFEPTSSAQPASPRQLPRGKSKSTMLEKNKGNKSKSKLSKSKSKLAMSTTIDTKKDKGSPEAQEYKEALDLMTECARLLYVRWLQAKLVKELINVIYKFNHRHWTMIIKEHKNRQKVGLWINTSRCLEIWDILGSTYMKKYIDEKILHTLLRIVQFYQNRVKAQRPVTSTMSAVEKNTTETDVRLLMNEHRIASKLIKEAEIIKKAYVKPELTLRAHKKFNVCFECMLRLREDKKICDFCELVSFCNLHCMLTNIEKTSGHPCNELLKEKYVPPPEDFEDITPLIV